MAYSREEGRDPIRVRIGLNTGKLIKDGDRFFGITVILAARIAAKAKGGETLISESAFRELADTRDLLFGRPREVFLKGLEGRQRMRSVAKRQLAAGHRT